MSTNTDPSRTIGFIYPLALFLLSADTKTPQGSRRFVPMYHSGAIVAKKRVIIELSTSFPPFFRGELGELPVVSSGVITVRLASIKHVEDLF